MKLTLVMAMTADGKIARWKIRVIRNRFAFLIAAEGLYPTVLPEVGDGVGRFMDAVSKHSFGAYTGSYSLHGSSRGVEVIMGSWFPACKVQSTIKSRAPVLVEERWGSAPSATW